jgi:hypothetical protein
MAISFEPYVCARFIMELTRHVATADGGWRASGVPPLL